MNTILSRTWNKWIAQKEDSTGMVAEGKTPEEAVRKLHAEYPELSSSLVIYAMKKKSVAKEINKCPVCGKGVVYINAKKPNGRVGMMVLHEDDAIPSDATEPNVGKDYKIELLKKLHKESTIKAIKEPAEKLIAKTEDTKSTIPATLEPEKATEEVTKPEIKVSAVKPKVVMTAKKTISLPVVDISGLKHNRFAIVGKIISDLRATGISEENLKTVRSDLISKGKDFETLIKVGTQYSDITENGVSIQ
jgi:ribosomal protein S27AE